MTASEISQLYSPAKAYWNQRDKLALAKDRLVALSQAVGYPSDLYPSQWVQLMAFALEFKPDIILELGRGYGNSTCAFAEAANLLKPYMCKVLSLCISDAWQEITLPKLHQIVNKSWFEPLETMQTDIIKFDFKSVLANQKRIFLFWDAHGYDIAECVLGYILPEIADKPHLVIMHDLSDIRYVARPTGSYQLWRGNNDSGKRIRIGNIDSAVEQAVSIMDFAERNKLVLHSGDHSLHTELSDSQKTELHQLLGKDIFSLNCHWFWFSLNETTEPYSFPTFSIQLEPEVYSQEAPSQETNQEAPGQKAPRFTASKATIGIIVKSVLLRALNCLKTLAPRKSI